MSQFLTFTEVLNDFFGQSLTSHVYSVVCPLFAHWSHSLSVAHVPIPVSRIYQIKLGLAAKLSLPLINKRAGLRT
jgi:hypothetical protein